MIRRLMPCILLAGLIVGCNVNVMRGSGTTSTETREVSGFHAVQLAWLGDLAITQGDTEGLTIEAEDNILPLITTKVEDGTLVIGIDEKAGKGAVIPTKPVKYTLQMKKLSDIELSGAGNISAPTLFADSLRVAMSGAGNVDIGQIGAPELEIDSSGAGNVKIGGSVDKALVTLSGLGNYEAGDMMATDVTVDISGAGNATVWAVKSLDVTIGGAGRVGYYGEPVVTKTINGAGTVTSLGAKSPSP